MAYNRHYSKENIHQILCASERRLRPDVPQHHAKIGHAITLHTEDREDFFSRPNVPPNKLPTKDSIFLGSRKHLILAVHEILNSIPGQTELKKLDHPGINSVVIRGIILRTGNEFDIFTVYRPRGTGKQSSFDWLSTHQGDGFIVQVFILVCKIPNSNSSEIHIQTAFPEDYARTLGDEILRPKI